MNPNIPRIQACRRELLLKHWEIVFTWKDFTDFHVNALAKEHNITVNQVRQLMREIAKKYPKPKRKSEHASAVKENA